MRGMKRALIVQGGWDGHKPAETAATMAGWLREDGFEVVVSATLDSFRPEQSPERYDLLVPHWTMGQIAKEQLQGLEAAVRAGSGLAGVHGGLGDSFRNATGYQFMTGGQFIDHPGGIIDYTVEIADAAHEITAGLGGFAVHSEQYYMHVDPANHLLATTVVVAPVAEWVRGVLMPVAWTRRHGAGRVFYCSVGHQPDDYEIPQFREMVRRGFRWAAR